RSRSFILTSPLVVALAMQLAPGRAHAEEPASERHGSAFVDPLGFLMFGPRLGVEAGGAHFPGGALRRWVDPGVLGRSLFLNAGDSFTFSYGVGGRGRYYFGDGQRGLHVGAGAEYLHTRVENGDALVATTSKYVVPYAEVGYRLPFG